MARNLEKKSRQKHRKITSLVGSATNTGTLVGVMAMPANVIVSKLNNKDTTSNGQQQCSPEDNDEAEDDFNTDSQSRLSKNTSTDITAAAKKKKRKEHLTFIRSFTKSGASGGLNQTANNVDAENNAKVVEAKQKLSIKPNVVINSTQVTNLVENHHQTRYNIIAKEY